VTALTPANLVQGEGWFMADLGSIQVVYLDLVTDAGHASFLEQLRRDLEALTPARRRGVLYEVTDRVRVGAAQRKAVGELLQEKREILAKVTSGYALVTPSVLVQGFLTAVFWFAPPPYPYTISTSLPSGLRFLKKQQPELDAEETLAAYAALKLRAGRS
jgi:hypothetical protein